MYTSHTIKTSSAIHIHYLDSGTDKPLLILLHGVTANAHAFDGLTAAGLDDNFRIVSVDLRGRGLSDHPATGYTVEDHVGDVLDVMSHLGAADAYFCGHSFGAFVSMYIAANHPGKVKKLIILDAGIRMNPRVGEMLGYRFSHLDTVYPSWKEYLAEIKAAPYNTFWDAAMTSYYRADVRPAAGGGVTPRPYLAHMVQASVGLSKIDWTELLPRIAADTLLIHAPENYNLGEPLLQDDGAQDTVKMIPHCRLITVPGNHQTMLYGQGAQEITAALNGFLLPQESQITA